MDPRIRARRAAVTRRQGRRRLWLLMSLLVVVGLAVAAWFVLHSSLLSAKVVRVEGSAHETPAQVIAAAGLAGRPPLLDVNPGASAAGVERLPWVRTATVQRQWPDGVRIVVTERRPAAVVQRTGAPAAGHVTGAPATGRPTGAPAAAPWAEVDPTGRVLADVAAPPPGLPTLTAAGSPGAPGTRLPAVFGPGVAVVATLPPAFAAQVTGVTVQPHGQLSLSLTSPVTVVLGDTSQLATKYEDVAAVLRGAGLHAGDVIDVSVPGAPTVTSR
jgi:cell division protein FtsQ